MTQIDLNFKSFKNIATLIFVEISFEENKNKQSFPKIFKDERNI